MFSLVLKGEPRQFKDHCCAAMTSQVNTCSKLGASPFEGSTDQRIYWSSLWDEYGLLCQPSTEILSIGYCPFCGTQLPKSRRKEWFEKLEAAGWHTWGDPIPQEFLEIGWAGPNKSFKPKPLRGSA
jgi:hypothetical protein